MLLLSPSSNNTDEKMEGVRRGGGGCWGGVGLGGEIGKVAFQRL